MVTALLTVLHVLVATILIFMVLLQKGKGADIGAAFGGASQTIFGPRGAQELHGQDHHRGSRYFHGNIAYPRHQFGQEKLGHAGCAADRAIAARNCSACSGTCAGTGLQVARHPC